MQMNLKRKLSRIILIFLFLLIFFPLQAKEIEIIKGVPEGFESPHNDIVFVDIYYEKQFLTSTRVEIKNNLVKILYPTTVYSKLPMIKIDKAKAVMEKLSKYNAFNSNYSCYPERKPECDMLNTNLIDIVFDSDNLNMEIIANNNIFIKQNQKNLYLAPPPTEFSQFFTFNGVGYWSKDKKDVSNGYFNTPPIDVNTINKKNQDLYNLTLNSKTSFNRFILNADTNWTNEQNNLYFDNINVTRYYRGYNLKIGEFATEELRSLNQGNLVGISFKSSVDRRRDDTNTFAQPLNVFLNYRSRVNLIKDGRIYSSEYYDSGTQTLNTEGLPSGSYNVQIEIIEPNGKTRKETQFFVKNGQLPPENQPYVWFEFGAIESLNGQVSVNSEDTQYFNRYDNDYLFRTGIYRRAFKAWGLGSNLILNKDISSAEAFLEYYGKFLSIRASFATDTKSDYSYNIYTELVNSSKFLVFFNWTQNYLTEESLEKDYTYRPISIYAKQGSGNIRYYFGSASNSFGVKGNYYRDFTDSKTYSIGPDIEFNIPMPYNILLRTTISAYKTNQDYQASLNFFVNFDSKYVQISNNSTYKMNKERFGGKDFSDRFDSSTDITLQDGGVFNQDLRFTGSYDKIDGVETKGLELDYRSGLGRFTADASTNSNINQYSVNFSSIFAFNKDHILFGGREPKQSALAIEIDGGDKSSKFDVYVNQNKTDFARGNSTTIIPLNPFDEYSVRLIGTGLNNTYLEDNKSRIITLYPGNIKTIKYKAKTTVILIGTLYSKNGEILKNTSVHGEVDEVMSDEDGNFQITAVLGEVLKVGNNRKYKLPKKFKKNTLKDNILFIDEVIATFN